MTYPEIMNIASLESMVTLKNYRMFLNGSGYDHSQPCRSTYAAKQNVQKILGKKFTETSRPVTDPKDFGSRHHYLTSEAELQLYRLNKLYFQKDAISYLETANNSERKAFIAEIVNLQNTYKDKLKAYVTAVSKLTASRLKEDWGQAAIDSNQVLKLLSDEKLKKTIFMRSLIKENDCMESKKDTWVFNSKKSYSDLMTINHTKADIIQEFAMSQKRIADLRFSYRGCK